MESWCLLREPKAMLHRTCIKKDDSAIKKLANKLRAQKEGTGLKEIRGERMQPGRKGHVTSSYTFDNVTSG